jgi:hemolysin activation/secretion protein
MKQFYLVAAMLGLSGNLAAVQNPPEPPNLSLPPLSMPKDRLSTMDSLDLKEIRLQGNQVLSTAELKAQISHYEGKRISAGQLQEIRLILTRYYVERGYINSGAVIPDQEARNGVVTIQIIEGRVSKIEVSGNDRLQTSYLTRRIEGGDEDSLNLQQLQDRLQLLQQDPLLKRFSAELAPGFKPGEAVLRLAVEEAVPYEFSIAFNNYRSPSVGAYQAQADLLHRNLTGWGDSLHGVFSLTEGFQEYVLDYSLPLTRANTKLELHAEYSDSDIISKPFNELDIQGKVDIYWIGLRQPLHESYKEGHYRLLDAGLALELNRSRSYLLDEPFSFPPLPEDANGVAKMTVLRFTQNWVDRSRDRVIGATSSFNLGIDAFDSWISDGFNNGQPVNEPDSEFFSWSGQLLWIERLAWRDSQLRLRADAQLAADLLLSQERFTLGGRYTVRGYRENQMIRDSGVLLSVEWQIPIIRLPIPGISRSEADGLLQIAPFIDYGRGWNHGSDTPQPGYLAGAGIGLLWNAGKYLNAELYWGKDLNSVATPEDKDLQDDGIYFQLEAKY